jgi:hypothetical protein
MNAGKSTQEESLMEFFPRRFPKNYFDLYPLGDVHFGSAQCDIGFFKEVVNEVASNDNAYWVGMGDFLENALVGSKSDVYTQTMPPREQINYICDVLKPIQKKGLFLIAGNHEQRTMRVSGMCPEEHMAVKLEMPFMGFSCLAYFLVGSHHWSGFSAYFHHNYGGGYTPGGKINRAEALRKITPTADAIFSGHFHTTSRMPVTWFEAARTQVMKHTGFDYITGSTLTWNKSYAEEKGKPASSVEFIRVRFVGGSNGRHDDRQQIYSVITKK